ncbi:MAG: GNAT family N-acetyltransferase [Planctomycetaceae bacterium]|jgi:predicted nucleotidyltransferase|nr:GNAT family N-acetyltransferase [Planctomycetaceae bacterium]
MNDGLSEKYRTEIRLIFESCPKIERAVLFGSRAKGTFRRDSDVDFALEGGDLVLSDLMFLNEKFSESNIPFDVDLLIRNKITNQNLETQINQHGIEFYKKKIMNGGYDYEWHLGDFSSNNDKLLEECAALFSAHYGKWSTNSSCLAGQNVRLSKNRIREWLKNPNSAVYMARNKGELIGYAIVVRLNIPQHGIASWVTQLVVHTNYRNQDVAKNILYSIWGFSDDFAWGLVSSNPYAVRALEKATRRRCNPSIIKKHVKKLLDACDGQVSYVHADIEKLVDCNTSKINTEFFVDHSAIDSMLQNVTTNGVEWQLGQLDEGWEWFAFTFKEQKQIALTKKEIEKMIQTTHKINLVTGTSNKFILHEQMNF